MCVVDKERYIHKKVTRMRNFFERIVLAVFGEILWFDHFGVFIKLSSHTTVHIGCISSREPVISPEEGQRHLVIIIIHSSKDDDSERYP